jgi:2-phospho-L-lactate guanylyltransferase
LRACLIPVKELSQAKGRLAPLLGEAHRRQLTLAMLSDVLEALQASAVVDLIAIISRDKEVLATAHGAGALALREARGIRGLNQALEFGRRRLRDARQLLVLPVDIPLLTPADVTSLLDAVVRAPSVALVPSAQGGTNALAMAPAQLIPFRFGLRSASAHEEEASRAGAEFRRLCLPHLAIDVDTPAALRALARRSRHGHTAELLRTLSLPGGNPAKKG